MAQLHVYANGVIDWFVAESPEEAWGMGVEYAKEYGLDVEPYDEMTPGEYGQEDDEKILRIDDDGDVHEHTCAEWCALKGKGFLCSTEY